MIDMSKVREVYDEFKHFPLTAIEYYLTRDVPGFSELTKDERDRILIELGGEEPKEEVNLTDFVNERAQIDYEGFARYLIEIYHFHTIIDSDEVLFYEHGYYHFHGAVKIKSEAESIFQKLISTHGVSEIIGHVKRKTYIDRDRINRNPYILNLKNGLYDIDTNNFREHTPNEIITNRIPVMYSPEAKCPEIDKFLSEVVATEEEKILLEEIVGFCLYRDYFIKKAFLLVGNSDNGKSIYTNVLEHFLGEENYCSIPLQRLTADDRFTNKHLNGKLANISADIPAKRITNTQFKLLTGDDSINAEIKGGEQFSFTNYAKMVFSANTVPQTDDLSDGFFSRWVLIQFPYTFTETPKEKHERQAIPKLELVKKLTSPKEMSGFLNVALNALRRLLEKGKTSYDKNTREIEEEYRRLSSNIYGFVRDRCDEDIENQIPKEEIYIEYAKYCQEKHGYPESRRMFNSELPKIANVKEARPYIDETQVRVWLGIQMKEEYETKTLSDY